jgi:hypothetical protein
LGVGHWLWTILVCLFCFVFRFTLSLSASVLTNDSILLTLFQLVMLFRIGMNAVFL